MDSQDVKTLTKLQAFIDQALGVAPGATAGLCDSAALSSLAGDCLTTSFLRMAIDDTPEYRRIAGSLRRTEAYSMVSFLLQQGQGEKLADLSVRYGISAGHFRRLF